jgi:hypothetical protein
LRILSDGVILKSEANLIVSRASKWSPGQRLILTQLLDAIGEISNDH